ncbi:unnamed protein product [Lepeophtheirus salmonis]|uniref:(salmon louse) hypothetical protein n=1 Tax=Lepeophtheirus salmonis TaxID=72036 RepID=A0A7R8CFC2_LEPSM|nr:unnamed protein product [Lepeophtheirus salmonis]CAF2764936.1 unnamed protein product [Lepeophtheirus salmonis]
MLPVVFELEKLHHYTYGRDLDITTDHKPLVSIVAKPLYLAPRRLQTLLLRTQKYQFTLNYRPGSQIPIADALSRDPLQEGSHDDIVTVNLIHFSPIKLNRIEQLKSATTVDTCMALLKQIKCWLDSKLNLSAEVVPYFSCRDELTVHDGIILIGELVVIPQSLRLDMKQKVHAGHLLHQLMLTSS